MALSHRPTTSLLQESSAKSILVFSIPLPLPLPLSLSLSPLIFHHRGNVGDIALVFFATAFVFLQIPAMGVAQAGLLRRKNSLSTIMQILTGSFLLSSATRGTPLLDILFILNTSFPRNGFGKLALVSLRFFSDVWEELGWLYRRSFRIRAFHSLTKGRMYARSSLCSFFFPDDSWMKINLF